MESGAEHLEPRHSATWQWPLEITPLLGPSRRAGGGSPESRQGQARAVWTVQFSPHSVEWGHRTQSTVIQWHNPHFVTFLRDSGPQVSQGSLKMTGGTRPSLVGRRFLSVTGQITPKLKNLYDWDWRAGWIRSATSSDCKDPDLQVCGDHWGHGGQGRARGWPRPGAATLQLTRFCSPGGNKHLKFILRKVTFFTSRSSLRLCVNLTFWRKF